MASANNPAETALNDFLRECLSTSQHRSDRIGIQYHSVKGILDELLLSDGVLRDAVNLTASVMDNDNICVFKPWAVLAAMIVNDTVRKEAQDLQREYEEGCRGYLQTEYNPEANSSLHAAIVHESSFDIFDSIYNPIDRLGLNGRDSREAINLTSAVLKATLDNPAAEGKDINPARILAAMLVNPDVRHKARELLQALNAPSPDGQPVGAEPAKPKELQQ